MRSWMSHRKPAPQQNPHKPPVPERTVETALERMFPPPEPEEDDDAEIEPIDLEDPFGD